MEHLLHLRLHSSWGKEDAKYLRERLDVLMSKSKELENGCVLWVESTPEKPLYNFNAFSLKISRKTQAIVAPRFVMLCFLGDEDSKDIVRHKCLTKGCHNPAHLEMGSVQDNCLDKFRDNTMSVKLTEEQVKAIIANPEKKNQYELAEQYGLNQSQVSRIQSGKRWNHITGIIPTKFKEPRRWTREEANKRVLDNHSKYMDYILSNVACNLTTKCWEWNKSTTSDGYGQTSVYEYRIRSHVMSWAITHRKFPEEKQVVRHLCNNPKCCNPEHLEIGSHSDNMKDRKLTGEKSHNAKLTEVQVLEIYELLKGKNTVAKIAKTYNICRDTVTRIRDGKTWKHLKLDTTLTGYSRRTK